MVNFIRRVLIGRPLPSDEAGEHKLGNFSALAVFASDALSSVAYATEEILLVLVLAGPHVQYLTPPIALAIVALIFIVTVSYRQVIHAYPSGGGAYAVAKENLGTFSGLVAGSALLIDYVLTVSVSVAAGVAAITSALPFLYDFRVRIALLAVGILTIGNLRGVRESGKLFAPPVYGFFGAMALVIVGGFYHYLVGSVPEAQPLAGGGPDAGALVTSVGFFLILRAFASGCTALTGLEAISNGVTAFRPPVADNASKVLRWLAMILAALFLGISVLAWIYGILPKPKETVISQLAREIFGGGLLFYVYVQVATAAILILAANTSFAGFPRLASLLARDGFLPRQLQSLGDRLVFSNGILLLAAFAGMLLVLFNADTHALIPLYAVGVFLSFTLSQSGMVLYHLRVKEPRWQRGFAINLLGAVTTAVVLLAILIAKFTHGAWLICLVVPVLIVGFYAVKDHYRMAARQLAVDLSAPIKKLQRHRVLVLVGNIHKGVVKALEYARAISGSVEAVTVVYDDDTIAVARERWEKWCPDVPLKVIEDPYRSLTDTLLKYIRQIDAENPGDLITIVIPSFVPAKWWHNFLHNQSSILLQAALRGMRNVVITSVRVHLDD
jgi:amino acid transporter